MGRILPSELPKLPLADALELLLLARDVEPSRDDRGAPRWHARLCAERRLSVAEAQLTLAALNALEGPGATGGAQALVAVCAHHGLDAEARVLTAWLAKRDQR